MPERNIGKICWSFEKYFNTKQQKQDVKRRPVLIIGCEDNYVSPVHVDYELLPISKIQHAVPSYEYDYLIDANLYIQLGLSYECYIRCHKTAWNHAKQVDTSNYITNLKEFDKELFNKIIMLNEKWVLGRNEKAKIYHN